MPGSSAAIAEELRPSDRADDDGQQHQHEEHGGDAQDDGQLCRPGRSAAFASAGVSAAAAMARRSRAAISAAAAVARLPAASSSVPSGAAAGSEAGTLSPAAPRSMAARSRAGAAAPRVVMSGSVLVVAPSACP
ncbi:MAG: hypothetical protein U1E53_34905 [Dongiaceae bacterium]